MTEKEVAPDNSDIPPKDNMLDYVESEMDFQENVLGAGFHVQMRQDDEYHLSSGQMDSGSQTRGQQGQSMENRNFQQGSHGLYFDPDRVGRTLR